MSPLVMWLDIDGAWDDVESLVLFDPDIFAEISPHLSDSKLDELAVCLFAARHVWSDTEF